MKNLMKEVWLLFRYYPLRSILSMTALIMGMATLTALVDIDNNINRNSEAMLHKQGTRLGVSLVNNDLDWAAFQKFKKHFEPHFSFYEYFSLPIQITYENQTFPVEVIAIKPALFEQVHWKVSVGRSLHPLDTNSKVALIGNEIAKMLPTETKISLQGEYYNIVGVLDPIDFDPILNFDPNYSVFVESSMASSFVAHPIIQNFIALVHTEPLMRAEASLLKKIQSRLPHASVFIKNPLILQKALYKNIDITLKTLKIISLTTLVLGFLSTLNLFLILLQERKLEMGLRLALGATIQDIGWQFFKETLLMCAIGGMLGVILGEMGGAVVIHHLNLNYYWNYKGILFGGVVSICVGIIVGMIPAIMTARQSPVNLL